MRLTVTALLAVASIWPTDGFEVGKEYVYSYSGKMKFMASEFPATKTGIRFNSSVRVQSVDDKSVALKIENFQIAFIDAKNPDLWNNDEKLESNERLIASVEKPFIVYFLDGSQMSKFQHLEVHALDPVWSVNIKKALANFMISRSLSVNDEAPVTKENTLFGDCKVYWASTKVPHETDSKLKAVEVTKDIDQEDCTKSIVRKFGLPKQVQCDACKAKENPPLRSSFKASYHYESSLNDPNKMVLSRIRGYSRVVNSPSTENGNEVYLTTIQNMDLITTKPSDEKLELKGDKEVHQNLHFKILKDDRIRRKINMKAAQDYIIDWEVKAVPETVIELMNQLIDSSSTVEAVAKIFDGSNPHGSISELIFQFDGLNYEQLNTVFKGIMSSRNSSLAQEIFVDIVASGGTNAGFQFLIDQFMAGKLDKSIIEVYLGNLEMTGITELTETSLEELLKFCKSAVVESSISKPRCLLVYSSLVRSTCMIQTEDSAEVCSNEKFQNKAFKALVPSYEEAKSDDLDLYVLIAQNLGTHEAVEFILKSIRDPQTDSLTKLNGLSSLIKIIPSHQPLIMKNAAEIYFNRKNPSDVRMMASMLLFISKPSLSLLQGLADDLVLNEPSDQVKSFVVSMIKELVDSHHPCHKALAQHLRYVAPMIAHKLPEMWNQKDHLTSHFKIIVANDEKYGTSDMSIFSLIMSDSYLPRQIYFGMSDYSGEGSEKIFEVQLRQQGLEQLLDAQFDPRTRGAKTGESLWDFMGRRRFVRSVDKSQYDPMKLQLVLGAYGQSFTLMNLNHTHLTALKEMGKDMFDDAFRDGFFKDQTYFDISNSDKRSTVSPTSIGFPVYSDNILPTRFLIKEKHASFARGPSAVYLKFNGHLVLDSTSESAFTVGVPGFNKFFGMGFDARLASNIPIDLNISVNLATAEIIIEKDLGKENTELVRSTFTPYSFLYDFDGVNAYAEHPLVEERELRNYSRKIDLPGSTLIVETKTLALEELSSEDDIGHSLMNNGLKTTLNRFLHNRKWMPRDVRVSLLKSGSFKENDTLKLAFRSKQTYPMGKIQSESKFEQFKSDLPESFQYVFNADASLVRDGVSKPLSETELRFSYTLSKKDYLLQMFHREHQTAADKPLMTCLKAEMKQTRTDWAKLNPGQLHLVNEGQRIKAMINVGSGSDCSSKATFNVSYEHSKQQQRWLSELKTGEYSMSNPYRKLYESCKKHMSRGLVMPISCNNFIVETSQLNRMSVDMKTDKTAEQSIKNMIETAMPYLVTKYGKYLEALNSPIQNGKKATFSSVVREPCIDTRVADIDLDISDYQIHLKNVPVSFGAHWAPRTANHLGSTNFESYSNKFYNRYCDIQKKSVRTFDGVFMNMSESGCWSVLAQDCSPTKLFSLTTRMNELSKRDWTLQVDKYSLKITHSGSSIMMNLDGEDAPLKDGERKFIENEDKHLVFILIRQRNMIILSSPVYGLYLFAEDTSVFVQTAPYYRGKLCGLCGNFNMDRQDEMKTADGCVHRSAKTWTKSFLVPSDQCSPVINEDRNKACLNQ